MYRGNGAGRFIPRRTRRSAPAGARSPRCWRPSSAATAGSTCSPATPTARLLMYRGNGRGGFVTGTGESIGGGWGGFTALLAPGDFSGDGKPDILARQSDGALLLYRGNGDSGFAGAAQVVGSGWQRLHRAAGARATGTATARPTCSRAQSDGDAAAVPRQRRRPAGSPAAASRSAPAGAASPRCTASGDFSGDGLPDILARASDGALLLYRGNGAGGFIAPYPQVGSGWQSLSFLTLVGQGRSRRRRRRRPRPRAPRSATAACGSTPATTARRPAAALHVSLKIRKRKGHKRPRVLKVVFFVRNGPRRVDRKQPYAARLRPAAPGRLEGPRLRARVLPPRRGRRSCARRRWRAATSCAAESWQDSPADGRERLVLRRGVRRRRRAARPRRGARRRARGARARRPGRGRPSPRLDLHAPGDHLRGRRRRRRRPRSTARSRSTSCRGSCRSTSGARSSAASRSGSGR